MIIFGLHPDVCVSSQDFIPIFLSTGEISAYFLSGQESCQGAQAPQASDIVFIAAGVNRQLLLAKLTQPINSKCIKNTCKNEKCT